ncbi:MAG: XylR family transcriptional regulator [Verrucomicrobiota bacterium]
MSVIEKTLEKIDILRHKAPVLRQERRRVAVLMGQELGYCRRVLSGILRFAGEAGDWEFRDGPPDAALLPGLLRWKPDGIIAQLYDRHLAGGLSRVGCPVVSTTDTLPGSGVPLVDVDSVEVGREAARYLLRRGFRSFAYYGSRRALYSRSREAGFREVLGPSGYDCETLHAEFLPMPPAAEIWRPSSERLESWLCGLSKPVGVFCSNDLPARRVAEACGRGGLGVPDEVAILGVDNDESECRLSFPPLSSVDTPAERIGYEAARVLAERMEVGGDPGEALYFPPLHVVTRASTDRWAAVDETVREALGVIERKAVRGAQVNDVARAVGVSRRQLERRFRSELRASVLEVIQHAKVDRAKELLAASDYRVAEIAERVGFGDAKRLGVVFKKATRMTPREYRKVMR